MADLTSKSLSKSKREGEFLPEIQEDINRVMEMIRKENASNAKLKHQYQKLYELLCSATSKNIRMVFNETLTV